MTAYTVSRLTLLRPNGLRVRVIWIASEACGKAIPAGIWISFTVRVSTRPWPLSVVVSAAGTCFQGTERSWRCRLGWLPLTIKM